MNIYKKILIILIFFASALNTKAEEIFVFGSNVNMRENPDEKSKSLRKLNGNNKGILIENVENENSDLKIWSKVRLEDDSEGYIYSDYVYDKPQNLYKGNKIFPEIIFEFRENKIYLIEKKSSKIYSTITYKKQAKGLNRTDQIDQYILITLTIKDYEYEGFIYDIEEKKIIFELNNKELDLMTCALESVSPQNIYLILDTGTSQSRRKYIFEISTWRSFKLAGISSSLDWIAPKTFIYHETPKRGETDLPIWKVNPKNDKEHYILQEKRIWNKGIIYRTSKTRYSYQE